MSIPKRPDDAPKLADFPTGKHFVYEAFERVFLRDSVAHEHAVAKRAVEALTKIRDSDYRGNRSVDSTYAKEVLREIVESGWVP